MSRHRQQINQAVMRSRRRSSHAQLWSNEGSDPIEDIIAFAAKVREHEGFDLDASNAEILRIIEQHIRDHPEEYKAQLDALYAEVVSEMADELRSEGADIIMSKDKEIRIIGPMMGGWIDMDMPPPLDDGGITISRNWEDEALPAPSPMPKDAGDDAPINPEAPQELTEQAQLDEEAANCPYDPELLKGQPMGMHHCPLCGTVCIAGMPHPKEFV